MCLRFTFGGGWSRRSVSWLAGWLAGVFFVLFNHYSPGWLADWLAESTAAHIQEIAIQVTVRPEQSVCQQQWRSHVLATPDVCIYVQM